MATMCPAFSNKGNSYAQLMATQSQPRLDACVLRAGAVQMMQNPGRSTALGKSSMRREPSLGVAPLNWSHSGAALSGAALRACTRTRVDESLGRQWLPHRDTERAAPAHLPLQARQPANHSHRARWAPGPRRRARSRAPRPPRVRDRARPRLPRCARGGRASRRPPGPSPAPPASAIVILCTCCHLAQPRLSRLFRTTAPVASGHPD